MSIRLLSGATDDHSFVRAQFCVVGAGMAGLFVARRLARAGYRVAVLESGRFGFDARIHELNAIIDINGRYTRALNGRYRGLGGSSSRWGGRMIPLYRHDVEAREHLGFAAWPFSFDELEAYAGEVETVFGLPHGRFDAEAVHDAHLRAFFPANDLDFACRWAKWINFRRCNLGRIWKNEFEQCDNIQIWLEATVTDFVLDTETARLACVTAKGFNGKSVAVAAEQFVVAAGAIETTRLLLWLQARSNGNAFRQSKALGRYFQDHLKAGVATVARTNTVLSNQLFGYRFIGRTRRSLHLDLSSKAQRMDGVASAFAYAALDMSDSPLAQVKSIARAVQTGQARIGDLLALARHTRFVARVAYWRYLRALVYMPPDVGLEMQIAIEQLPDWANFIALSDQRDPLGLPRIALTWSPRSSDEQTFQSTMARLKTYWTRSGLDSACPLTWRLGTGENRRPVTDFAEAYAHPSGTTRMGTDPATSVVGPDLACHGLPNISVASASTFPTAGSANPTFTLLKLALRLADRLIANARAQGAYPVTGTQGASGLGRSAFDASRL